MKKVKTLEEQVEEYVEKEKKWKENHKIKVSRPAKVRENLRKISESIENIFLQKFEPKFENILKKFLFTHKILRNV